jgi:hypothetical protein
VRLTQRVGLRVLVGLTAAVSLLALASSASAVPERALHGLVVVGKGGDGEGRITSSPGGIDCGPVCSFSFISTDDPANYQPVTLTAVAEPGSQFQGFGECGTNTCTIDPIEPGRTYEVDVEFLRVQPSQFALTVAVSGQGRVKTSPGGIDCPPTCSASFATNSTVALTATPTPGWSFAGWGGACSGTGPCSIAMNQPRSVTATFAPPGTVYALAVASAGGAVTSDIGGIACGDRCVSSFGAGVDVTLTPSATPVVWGGACSGSDACVVPMTRARAVTASIGGARPSRMPVAVGVTGKGTIASRPAGISCGDACGALFATGSRVTLGAAPAPGWIFAGWSGSCHGVAASCTVQANAASSSMAAFVQKGTRFPVAVTKAGKGRVKSQPGGIACGSDCTGSFAAGSHVTLTAIPDRGWNFVRWGGDCRGRKPSCELGLSGPQSVSATFARPNDRVAPVVKALPSSGAGGVPVRLPYRVTDASPRTRETATVYRGTRPVVVIRGRWHALEADTLFYFLTWAKPMPGAFRFCVSSQDLTGNRSKPSCAPLHVS